MGENLFVVLEEHRDRVEELIANLHEPGTSTPPLEEDPIAESTTAAVPRKKMQKKTEHILAASALVSLADPNKSASV